MYIRSHQQIISNRLVNCRPFLVFFAGIAIVLQTILMFWADRCRYRHSLSGIDIILAFFILFNCCLNFRVRSRKKITSVATFKVIYNFLAPHWLWIQKLWGFLRLKIFRRLAPSTIPTVSLNKLAGKCSITGKIQIAAAGYSPCDVACHQGLPQVNGASMHVHMWACCCHCLDSRNHQWWFWWHPVHTDARPLSVRQSLLMCQ